MLGFPWFDSPLPLSLFSLILFLVENLQSFIQQVNLPGSSKPHLLATPLNTHHRLSVSLRLAEAASFSGEGAALAGLHMQLRSVERPVLAGGRPGSMCEGLTVSG